MVNITNVSIFDVGVKDTEPKKEEKKTASKSVNPAAKPKEKKEEIKINNEWTVHFATEHFIVTDFIEEIPEEGITLEELRKGIERVFPKFSAARTKFDVDKENKRIFPDAFAGSKGAGVFTPSFFLSKETAIKSNSYIKYLLGEENSVFRVITSTIGTFITKIDDETISNDVRSNMPYYNESKLEKINESFTLNLPKIPYDYLLKIISFFKFFINQGDNYEVACKIFWDKENGVYIIDVPQQTVTKVSVHLEYSGEYTGRNSLRYIPVLEIHSHNVMRAYFSKTDDLDEQEYGLYGVIGRLNRKEIQSSFRVKCGDSHLHVGIDQIFELENAHMNIPVDFPNEWLEKVTTKKGLYL